MLTDSPAAPAAFAARPRDRAATETTIIAAAERLLLQHGWTGLNVQTLAAEAGIDRKLVYRYFDGVDGVVERLAAAQDQWLARTLAEHPPSNAVSYRQFARETLTTWLRALKAGPLLVRMLAWELAQDTPLLRRTEAARSAVVQAWIRDRRPRLKAPPTGDIAALNSMLLAAVQHLVLSAHARGTFAGVTLDDAGWARIEAALDTLTTVWPD